MRHLLEDLGYAVRGLRKAPLFTVVAVLSMSFGIAANTAVFTLVDQVILRTLPVEHPGDLVQVSAPDTESYGGGMGDGTELSYPMYKDLREGNRVLRRHVLPDVDERVRRPRRHDRAGIGRARVGHVLSAARRPPGRRAALRGRRGSRGGCRALRGALARLLAGPFCRRPRHRRAHGDHQQLSVRGDRRRGAAIRGPRSRAAAAGLRADYDAAPARARVAEARWTGASAGSRPTDGSRRA